MYVILDRETYSATKVNLFRPPEMGVWERALEGNPKGGKFGKGLSGSETQMPSVAKCVKLTSQSLPQVTSTAMNR